MIYIIFINTKKYNLTRCISLFIITTVVDILLSMRKLGVKIKTNNMLCNLTMKLHLTPISGETSSLFLFLLYPTFRCTSFLTLLIFKRSALLGKENFTV